MLKIQSAQKIACDAVARQVFIERVQRHLSTHFAQECHELGDAELLKLIEAGIERAAQHGIKAEDGVAKFITLMLLFGRGFDEDPQHAWAKQLLNDEELASDPIAKADALYEAALEKTRIDQGGA